jgi:hypothetical protein
MIPGTPSTMQNLITLLCFCAIPAQADPAAVPPAFAPVTDDPALPRVLLLGDSISIGYTLPVREQLRGVANVHRPPVNCGSTNRAVSDLEGWLGEGRWDVIHFNFGLHDALPADGARRASRLRKYEDNLRRIVGRLKRTGAKLIWASTTPLPSDVVLRDDKPVHYERDIVEYNRIARSIMQENGVAIDDLHAFAVPRLKSIQIPHDIHFTEGGSKQLALQVAVAIRLALGQPDNPH